MLQGGRSRGASGGVVPGQGVTNKFTVNATVGTLSVSPLSFLVLISGFKGGIQLPGFWCSVFIALRRW